MKKIFALLLGIFPVVAAATDTWVCIAHDTRGKEWQGQSAYQRGAINYAFEACKKESLNPQSCNSSELDCEGFVNGQSTRPLWRCVALDQMAMPWESNLYRLRDDAAIAARSYCADNSNFPDTCYVNLMTCQNVNTF